MTTGRVADLVGSTTLRARTTTVIDLFSSKYGAITSKAGAVYRPSTVIDPPGIGRPVSIVHFTMRLPAPCTAARNATVAPAGSVATGVSGDVMVTLMSCGGTTVTVARPRPEGSARLAAT